jgi:GNAT superfamily N-acetyltransferase
MDISIKFGTDNIDWADLCEIFRRAPLGTREPDKLKIAAENSHTVCCAYADKKIIGFARALSDGRYQSQGVGKSIMKALLEKLPKDAPVILFSAPGKQNFYRKFGFGNLKTGMGLFPNPEMSRAKGYLE